MVPLGVPVKSVLAVVWEPLPPPLLQAARARARTGRVASTQRCVFLMVDIPSAPSWPRRRRERVMLDRAVLWTRRRPRGAVSWVGPRVRDPLGRSARSALAPGRRDALDEVPLAE